MACVFAGNIPPEFASMNDEGLLHVRNNLTRAELQEEYKKASVLIFPSRMENFGNVVVEALDEGTMLCVTNDTHWSVLLEDDLALKTENLRQFVIGWQSLSQIDFESRVRKTISAVNRRFLIPHNLNLVWSDIEKSNFQR
jgi:glycosyltransferase involved in cell wall biosynthesis